MIKKEEPVYLVLKHLMKPYNVRVPLALLQYGHLPHRVVSPADYLHGILGPRAHLDAHAAGGVAPHPQHSAPQRVLLEKLRVLEDERPGKRR